MTQTRQLHDLAVVDEQVHVDAEFPNVPVVHLGVCSFEHDPFLGKFLHDTGDHVRSPRVHVLRDTLRFDHQAFHTGVEELVAQVHQFTGVGCADGFQTGSWGVTASTELDAQFGLGFEFVRVHLVHEAEPVILGEGQETGRELDDIEAAIVRPMVSDDRGRMDEP